MPATSTTRPAVTLRQLTPHDRTAVVSFYQGLSERSLYLRFGSATVGQVHLEHLTKVDGQDHVAWGAFRGGVLVGTGRFVRFRHCGATADVALTVADVYQHQGLGQLLLERLARVAGAHGVEWFSFTVLGDNHRMQRLLERHGVWLHFEAGQGDALVPAAHFLGRTDGAEH